jgi:hypothetical protein
MESFLGFLRGAVESGWRFGFVLLVLGVSIPTLDHFNIPKPGVLEDWVGYSTAAAITGAAIIVVSLISTAGACFWSHREEWANRRNESREVLEAIQVMSKGEIQFLYAALSGPRSRFVLHTDHVYLGLIDKKIVVIVGDASEYEWICTVHPAVLAEKYQLLPALKVASESDSEFPSVQRHEKKWTAVCPPGPSDLFPRP